MGGAKNCPETPRQKMIGMMYLVLTAMLALNVSADILNGFTKLRTSMEDSSRATLSRSVDALAEFQKQNAENDSAYTDWVVIAEAVYAKSNELYDYIDNFKLEIINFIDGTEYQSMDVFSEVDPETGKRKYKVNANDDTHKPHLYALEEKDPNTGRIRADEFKYRLDEYREYVTVITSPCLVDKYNSDDAFKKKWDMKVVMMSDMFSTDNVIDSEGESLTWQLSTFNEMPAAGVLAVLSKYQYDVRVAENDLINFMAAQAGASKFKVNQVEPVILATSQYVMAGDHYRAKIVSAAIDTTQPPRVFVNGVELVDGIYEFTASGAGDRSYEGYMIMPDNPNEQIPFVGKYTVGVPSAVISNTALNVMYRGYDNPFSISVPGVEANKVSITCENATATKGANGTWVVKPTSADGTMATITVFAESDGKKSRMGSQQFRVKDLPDPKVYFSGKRYYDPKESVPRADLLASGSQLVCDYPADALVKAKFTINSFEVKMPNGETFKCTGSKFSGKATSYIKNNLKIGNTFNIRKINATGPDGKARELDPVGIEIK